MQGDNTDNSMFTIPIGPDQEPVPHPPQTQPEHFLPLLTSNFKMDADFTGNISNRDNWETMQKHQNTVNMNNESSWKLKIGTYYRMSWFG